jgi:AcrR family transcriptional regulator
MRIVKNPEERRKEIMQTAAQFFLSQGYEETSINMIVEYLGIAKGTFYHYFKSKEEILGAILEEYLERFAQQIRAIASSNKMNASEKLEFVLKSVLKSDNEPKHLTAHVEDNKSAKLHQMMEDKFYEKFKPIFFSILQHGIGEGIFKSSYPEELTEILLIGVRGYMHIHLPGFSDLEYVRTKLMAIEELFNKVLDVDEKYKIRLI